MASSLLSPARWICSETSQRMAWTADTSSSARLPLGTWIPSCYYTSDKRLQDYPRNPGLPVIWGPRDQWWGSLCSHNRHSSDCPAWIRYAGKDSLSYTGSERTGTIWWWRGMKIPDWWTSVFWWDDGKASRLFWEGPEWRLFRWSRRLWLDNPGLARVRFLWVSSSHIWAGLRIWKTLVKQGMKKGGLNISRGNIDPLIPNVEA